MLIRYSAVVDTTPDTVDLLTDLFDSTRIRYRGLSSRDRAIMTIVYNRHHHTLKHLAESFGCSIGGACTIVATGTALLAEHGPGADLVDADLDQVLDGDDTPEEVVVQEYVVTDGTFLHTQNAWSKGYYNHKHRTCGMVFLTLVTPSGIPLWFSEPHPGSVHDMTLLKDCGVVEILEARGIGVVADKGFQGLDPTKHLTPVKKPKGGRLTAAMREYNYWVTRLRIPVETVFARLKRYQIMVKCRRHTTNVGTVLRAVLTLHALEGRTW